MWYYEDWKEINKVFTYEHVVENDPAYAQANKFADKPVENQLNRILNDTGRLADCEKMWKDLEALKTQQPEEDIMFALEEPPLDFHCVAVVFRNGGRFLIAKRPMSKRFLPGKWEFGCAQVERGLRIEESIAKHYKADFGLELQFPCPHPFRQYYMEEKGTSGIICVAIANNPEAAQATGSPSKHDEIKWVSVEESEKIPPKDCVDGFEDTVKDAVRLYKSHIAKND